MAVRRDATDLCGLFRLGCRLGRRASGVEVLLLDLGCDLSRALVEHEFQLTVSADHREERPRAPLARLHVTLQRDLRDLLAQDGLGQYGEVGIRGYTCTESTSIRRM
eukprot:3109461-Rhodomonas_salina.1